MNDVSVPPPDDADEAVKLAFGRTGQWAHANASLPGAGRALRTARRRRAATSAAATLGAVAVISGMALGVVRLQGPDTVQPEPVSPEPTSTASADTSARVPPTSPATSGAAPPTEQGPTASGTAGAASDSGPDGQGVGAGGGSGVPTAIPAEFDLLADSPSLLAEAEITQVGSLEVDMCRGVGLPGAQAATDSRFVQITAPEQYQGRGLLVFADADAAVGFVSGLRMTADACADEPSDPGAGTDVVVREPLAGVWGSGSTFLLVDEFGQGENVSPPIGAYLLVIRIGSAVALTYLAGENFVAEPYMISEDVADTFRAPLDLYAPQMCRWTVAGCASPPAEETDATDPTPTRQVPVVPRGGVDTGDGSAEAAPEPDTADMVGDDLGSGLLIPGVLVAAGLLAAIVLIGAAVQRSRRSEVAGS